MTSPFADASVEIIADFSRFDEEFGRGLRARIKTATAGASKEFDQLGTAAKRAGDTVTRNMRTAGESVRTSFAGGTREAVRNFDGVSAAAKRVSVSVTDDMRRGANATRTSFAGVSDAGSRVFATIGTSARNASRDIQAAFNPAALRILFDPLVTGARNAVTRVQSTLGGPAMRRVFDGITDAGRLASVRLSTDLPGAAATIRGAFAGLGDTIRSSFAGISTGGLFTDITTGSATATTEVDDDFSRMANRVIGHFQSIGRQAATTSAEIIASFKAAGVSTQTALRFGNPFQLLVARAVIAGQAVQRSMQLAAFSARRSLAQTGVNAARDFGRISDAARVSGLRVGASMRAAGRNLREAFETPRNPFTLLVTQAAESASDLIDRFRGAGRTVKKDVAPAGDPFTKLVDFAVRAAREMRARFRAVGDNVARDFTPPRDPFDRVVRDAKRAARDISDEFRRMGQQIAGDLGAGVADPFNVITRQADEAARDIRSEFRGTGRKISDDVNPPGNPFDGLVRQSAAAQRDVSENMREAGGSIARTMAAAAGASAIAGGVSVLSGGLAGLAVSAAAVTAALAPMAGALLGLPAVLSGVGIGVAALSVGLDGMDKIFASLSKDKPKDFAKELAKLSPAARAFALELRRLQPAFEAMKNEVQDTLFAGLVPVLRSISGNLLPVIRAGLSAMTAVFNTVAKGLGKFLADPKTATILRDIFADAATAASALAEAVLPASKALLGLVAAGGPGIRALADGIRSMAEGFAAFVANGVKSGEIVRLIQNGMNVAVQFGRILGDIGGILLGVFKAAGQGSESLLGGIEKVTSSVRDMVNSAAGQEILGSIFRDMRELASATLPVFKQLAVVFGTAFLPILKEFGVGLGPGLADGIKELGTGMKDLIPVAKPVGKAVGDIAREIGRLLKESGPILADALREFPGFAAGIVALLRSTTSLVKALQPLARPLFRTLSGMSQAASFLAGVLVETLIPALRVITPLFRGVFNFVADQLETQALAFKLMIPDIQKFGKEFTHFFVDVVPFGVELMLDELKDLGKVFTESIPQWVKKAGKAINDFFAIDTPLTLRKFGTAFSTTLSNVAKAVTDQGGKITGWFTALPVAILKAVTGLDVSIAQKFADMLAGVFRVLTGVAGTQVTGWFAGLPGGILRSLSVTLFDVPVSQRFTDMLAGVLRTVTDRGALVLAWFTGLPTTIGRSLDGLARLLSLRMTQAINGMLGAAAQASTALLLWFIRLPASLYQAIYPVPGLMIQLGEAIIEGLARGLKSMADKIIPRVMQDIANYIPYWMRTILEVRSPSRVMERLGAQAIAGVPVGLLSGLGKIREVMALIAGAVAQDLGTPVIGTPVINRAAVAAAAVVPVAAPVTPVVPVQRAAPAVPPGGLTPAALAGAGSGLTVVNHIALPTGDPLAAAQTIVNRVAASVLAGGA